MTEQTFDFALTLRCYRKSLGLDQGELAELLDVAQATVSRWEAGIRAPRDPVEVLMRLHELSDVFDDVVDDVVEDVAELMQAHKHLDGVARGADPGLPPADGGLRDVEELGELALVQAETLAVAPQCQGKVKRLLGHMSARLSCHWCRQAHTWVRVLRGASWGPRM
jgi:DNA-binding helix-turn-helix protein